MRPEYIKFNLSTLIDVNNPDNITAEEIIEAKENGEKPKLPTFKMTAYTGGIISQWYGDIIIDLDGVKAEVPFAILYGHDINDPIAHAETAERQKNSIILNGVFSGYGYAPNADRVVGMSKNQFPWQASVGGKILRLEEGHEGKTVVNGISVPKGTYIAREFLVRETSVTAVGADKDTRTKIAASHQHQGKEFIMGFEAWLKEKGFVQADLSDEQLATLKAAWQSETATPEPTPVPDVRANGESTQTPEPALVAASVDLGDIRAAHVSEMRRIQQINKICGTEFADIAANAIENGSEPVVVENLVLKAKLKNRPESFNVIAHQTPDRESRIKQIAAAACMTAGIEEKTILKDYGEQTVEAAYTMSGISIREIIAEAMIADGQRPPRTFGNGKAFIEAAVTVVSLPGIFEDAINKTMLQAYGSVDKYADILGSASQTKDFKQATRHRLLGTGAWNPVTDGGELKHGKLGEQKYTNQAEMYGQIIVLTRKDIINDDLNAFLSLPRDMGLGAATLVDEKFFEAVLGSSDYTTGNGNYKAGADTAFGFSSLSDIMTYFRKMKVGPTTKAKDKRLINIKPKYLVVPVELETSANKFARDAMLITGEDATIGAENPFRGKFTVVSPPHISDADYTGYSAKAWYLWADPKMVSAFDVVYLNGVKTPTIYRVQTPANILGAGWAGYIDFGVAAQDYHGSVKFKGEA